MRPSAEPKRLINSMPLSKSDLASQLDYSPETGIFMWISSGKVAGNTKPSGYITIQISGGVYYAHRLAWLYMTGSLPKIMIDHINRKRSDNRFINLREATDSENQLNRADASGNSRNGICTGVSWNSKRERWEAFLKRDNKRVFFKRFRDIESASAALVEARLMFPPNIRDQSQ